MKRQISIRRDHHPRRSVRRGTITVAVIVALIMLQLLAIALTVAGARDQDLTARRLEAARALYAAEGGTNMALRELTLNSDEDGDGGIGSVWANNPGAAPPIGFGGGVAPVSISVSGTTTTLIATGTKGIAKRAVTCVVNRIQVPLGAATGLHVQAWNLPTAVTNLAGVPWNARPSFVGAVADINLPSLANSTRWPGGPSKWYGLRFSGVITIPAAGTWQFRTSSDDGSALYINDVLVVNNDGAHSARSVTGSIVLPAGNATFEMRYFENTGTSVVSASWQGPGVPAMTVIPASAFSFDSAATIPPIAVAATISINGKTGSLQSQLDGYDSRVGAYGASNILTSGVPISVNSATASAWTIAGNAQIWADALVGPGGSTSSGIVVTPPATLTGTPGILSTRILMMNEALPANPPASSGALNATSSRTFSGTARYSSFTASGVSTTLTVSGTTTLIVDGDFTMTGGAQVSLASNASLTLFVGGNLAMNSDSRLNATSADPKRVRIHMIGAAKDLSVDGNAELHATVRNPFGRLVFLGVSDNTPHFFGTFHGNAIAHNQRGRIHADRGTFPIASEDEAETTFRTSVWSWSQTP